MAIPASPMHIPKAAQQGIVEFAKSCTNMSAQHWNIRQQMREIDLAYMREQDWTTANRRAGLANRYGDSDKLQNITVPVVMPQVEAAVAYQSSVFLTGVPIFETVAHPQFEDAALQMNVLMADQATKGGWVRELQLFFRDGFKYNLSALEVAWDTKIIPILETDLAFDAKLGKPKQIQWEGNILKRLDLYNTEFDSRCAPVDIPAHGEFVSYTELKSRVALKDFINKLPTKLIENINIAFESGMSSMDSAADIAGSYYTPMLNSGALLDKTLNASTDWMSWAQASNSTPTIQYRNQYQLKTLYGRIIPSDFGLKVPAANTPQVWKFIYVNNILIYAERQTNAHQLIPVFFGQPLEDGLQYQTKSLATNALPFQQVSSALLNSSIAASRKAIFDRMIYDPSRIREGDINNSNPASKIPVKPSAYGKNVGDAAMAIPFRDDQSGLVMQKITQLAALTDEATGRNRSQRGLFTKGNRTKEEYVDVMQHATGRDQLTSMLYESQVFTPVKEILKINILQYQGGTQLYSAQQQEVVTIDPVALRKAVLEFKVSDGLTPTSKQISGDVLTIALQTMGASPQIAADYNVGAAFSYLMKTQGADLKPFEKSAQQRAYEQAVGQWQQAVQNIPPEFKGQLPPQPLPEQFGYTPGALVQQGQPVQQPPTIMQQVTAATSASDTATPPQ